MSTQINEAGRAPNGLLPLDERRYTRMGWMVILIGVVGFLAWAALAPLDKGWLLPVR
ncbi:Uncharacterised protein [Serratia rubidaea]|uniref:Uncharacterized protein n=1 Tax=Serratia rubidaea TaxID=61652 RepID=A0A3S4G0L3_SERRU|nr:Uncharacterised protein [Serratia rubidaea]